MSELTSDDIRVHRPLRSVGGALCERVTAAPTPILASLTEAAPGMPPERTTTQTLPRRRMLGRIVGRMHALSLRHPQWRRGADPAATATQGRDHRSMADFLRGATADDPQMQQRIAQTDSELESLPIRRDTYGYMHGDLSLGNTVEHAGIYTVIDFEGGYRWDAADLATTAHQIRGAARRDATGEDPLPILEPSAESQWHAFVSGYRQENELPEEWLDWVPLLVRQRDEFMFAATWSWRHLPLGGGGARRNFMMRSRANALAENVEVGFVFG